MLLKTWIFSGFFDQNFEIHDFHEGTPRLLKQLKARIIKFLIDSSE